MSTLCAPIFNAKWEHRRKLQVRLPDPREMALVRQMLQDPFPFFVNIFDSLEQFNEVGTLSGVFASNGMAAFAQAEGRATLPEDFWLVAITSSFSLGTGATSFSWQLYHTRGVGEADEQGFTHQQSPMLAGVMTGTGQKPMYLSVPKYIPRNTEVTCTVQNLQASGNNQIQVVLHGYLGEPAGGLT